jgi:hypothetical protein
MKKARAKVSRLFFWHIFLPTGFAGRRPQCCRRGCFTPTTRQDLSWPRSLPPSFPGRTAATLERAWRIAAAPKCYWSTKSMTNHSAEADSVRSIHFPLPPLAVSDGDCADDGCRTGSAYPVRLSNNLFVLQSDSLTSNRSRAAETPARSDWRLKEPTWKNSNCLRFVRRPVARPRNPIALPKDCPMPGPAPAAEIQCSSNGIAK